MHMALRVRPDVIARGSGLLTNAARPTSAGNKPRSVGPEGSDHGGFDFIGINHCTLSSRGRERGARLELPDQLTFVAVRSENPWTNSGIGRRRSVPSGGGLRPTPSTMPYTLAS